MTDILSGEPWRVVQGDCLDFLRGVPDGCVDCCVTSPPYFNLRDYGVQGQMGLEKLHDCAGWATGQKCGECFICRMTAVFSEVRRVLRDDGTCWVNVGDSYVSSPVGRFNGGGEILKGRDLTGHAQSGGVDKTKMGVPPKNLMLIPQRLALSLQADSWFVRSEVIWHKLNPMPESVTDRPTKAHEQVWLLSKSERYFYDADAIREPSEGASGWAKQRGRGVDTWEYNNTPERIAVASKRGGKNPSIDNGSRNRRSVWTISTQPYSDAHFATFPPELIRPMIRAGCRKGGIVLDPFTGSGTTGMVALSEGCRFIGSELNPEYVNMARCRIARADMNQNLFAVPPSPTTRQEALDI